MWFDNSHSSLSIKHMMIWLNDPFNPINQWPLSHQCLDTNVIVQIKPHYILHLSQSKSFWSEAACLPVMNPIWETQMKIVWQHEATFENCLQMWFIYGSRFLCRPLFDKTVSKETFTPLHKVQTFLLLPSRSCICEDAAEWLILPSCLSGSTSISSAARLTWIDDTLTSSSTFVPFSFSMDIRTSTSGNSPTAQSARAVKNKIKHWPQHRTGRTCLSRHYEFGKSIYDTGLYAVRI